jgi:hypothetical protein
MMMVIGCALLVVAAVWLLYKIYLAFNSAGGTDLMLVVYDAAVYPPLLIAGGLYLVTRACQVQWPIWAYALIWLGTTLLAAGAIRLSEELGDRRLR